MSFDRWTLALQAVNFLVLVWLLRRFLYRPVLAAIDARRATLRRAEETAKDARRAAEAAAEAQAARLAEIDSSRRGILAAAEHEAKTRGEHLLDEARAEAERILARARAEIDRERHAAAVSLREQAVRLGGEVARRLLRDSPKPPAEIFLERLEAQLAAVSASEIQRLGAEGAVIEVACQPPLAPDESEAWRRRLGRHFGAVSIRFIPAPAILAGVRVSFPGARLEASWDDALARAEKELSDDARTG